MPVLVASSLTSAARALPLALILGLLLAAIPVIATHDRACTSAGPRPGAPLYLALTSDQRIEELRCESRGGVAVERVRTPTGVDARLADESVSGVILDRHAFARMRPGQVREWLTAGSGRVIVGLDLTQQQLRSGSEGTPPAIRGEGYGTDLGDSYYGLLQYRTVDRGSCGGGGSTPFQGGASVAECLVALSARCSVELTPATRGETPTAR